MKTNDILKVCVAAVKSRQKKARKLLYITFGILFVCVLSMVVSFSLLPPYHGSADDYHIVFTTCIEQAEQGYLMPVDYIEEISISEGGIAAYINWFYLKTGKRYEFLCKIFDEPGNLLHEQGYVTKPEHSSWITPCKYQFKADDKPGKWRFEISMTGYQAIEKQLVVLPENEGVAPDSTASSFCGKKTTGEQSERYETTAGIVKNWIRQEQFDKVETLMWQLLEDKTRTRNGYLYAASVVNSIFIDTDRGDNIAALLPKLDTWVEHSPSSSMAHTLRGSFYYGYAWKARGTDWASTVSDENWALMRERLALAVRDLEMAYALNQTNPLPSWLMLEVARTLGSDYETMELHFQRAIKYDPAFYRVYWAKLNYLMPKWSGSEEAMFNFARESVQNAPRGTVIPALIVEAHKEEERYLSADKDDYYNTPQVWSEIQATYQQLMEDFPQSGIFPMRYAKIAISAGKIEEARKYYDLALERDPNAFEVRYERGLFFETYEKDMDQALEEFIAAIALKPYSLKAWGSLRAIKSKD